MIPISDNVRGKRIPVATYCLIGINIMLFFWELKLELSGELSNFIYSWGVIPSKISLAIADAISGNPAAWVVVILSSTSLLTGMFLHGSFSQILGNSLFLWVFGKSVEKAFGHGKFLSLYLICGVITGLIQILAEPTLKVPLIGANAAIASLLGAYAFRFPKAKVDTILPLIIVFIPIEVPASLYLLWWFLQQLFYSVGSLNINGGVNPSSAGYWAHAAGIFVGGSWARFRS
ncbi:MAG: rhomboid family intramembrane serine protease [Mastigocoleus sp. MO_167.B18]|nr:rhomboid family intramembrane serine protease [Mastigocoleus sp. MO_167.B18]